MISLHHCKQSSNYPSPFTVPEQPPQRPALLLLLQVPAAPDRSQTLQTLTCTTQRFPCLPAAQHLPPSALLPRAGLLAGSPAQNARRPGSRNPTSLERTPVHVQGPVLQTAGQTCMSQSPPLLPTPAFACDRFPWPAISSAAQSPTSHPQQPQQQGRESEPRSPARCASYEAEVCLHLEFSMVRRWESSSAVF